MATAMMDGLSSRHVGILFAEDFDAPSPLSAHAAPEGRLHGEPRGELPIAPHQPVIDVDAIHQRAFAEGRDAAMAQIDTAAAERFVRSQALLEKIAHGIHHAAREREQLAEASAEGIARVVLAMLNVALPSLCARHGPAEVVALTRAILPALAHAPTVVIRVGPGAVGLLHEELGRLDADVRARIAVTPIDGLADGDVRISWRDGCVHRDTAALARAIEEALAPIRLLDPVALQGADQ